jgi:hypothetical protein
VLDAAGAKKRAAEMIASQTKTYYGMDRGWETHATYPTLWCWFTQSGWWQPGIALGGVNDKCDMMGAWNYAPLFREDIQIALNRVLVAMSNQIAEAVALSEARKKFAPKHSQTTFEFPGDKLTEGTASAKSSAWLWIAGTVAVGAGAGWWYWKKRRR